MLKKIRILLFCFMLPLCALAEEEIYLSDIPIESSIYIELPQSNQTFEAGGTLPVVVTGNQVDSLEAVLSWKDDNGQEQSLSYRVGGSRLEHVFECGNMCYEATLVITATMIDTWGNPKTKITTRKILSPKQDLINRMIALAEKNSTQKKYKFAPAETDTDIGVCKNFVMRLFDTFKSDYRMLEYPELELHMPKNNSKVNCAPYDYGIEWRPETAEDGSPFEIIYQFKYDDSLTKEENAVYATEMMKMVKKGDFFQMVGYYGGGNGPHSLFFIADYDEVNDVLRWTDSNMRGKRIDGVRWGYLQFDADATLEWYVNVFNMKKRGATLYRLRDDLYRPLQ